MKSALRAASVLALSLLLSACPDGSSSNRANITWSRSFGGPAWDEAAGAIPTSDGGYLFAGMTGALYDTRDVSDFHQLGGEVWVVKLNASGNPDWERTYGEPFLSPAGNRIEYSLAADAGGGETWVAGVDSASEVALGDPLADGGNLVVARLDDAGGILFQRVYDSGEFLSFPFTSLLGTAHESVRAIAATSDGGLLAACWLSARVDKPDQMRDRVEVNALWVVKLDDVGDVIWDIHLVQNGEGVERDRFFPYQAGATICMDLCASDDGGALLSAYSSAEPDSEIVRLQSIGNVLWSKTLEDAHVRDAAAIDADADGLHDDGFVLAGIEAPSDDRDGFLLYFDLAGNPVWDRIDDQVDGFECVAQGEYIDSGGLQMPACAAAGIGGSGAERDGRILFVSLDGSDSAVIDDYIAEQAPEIRFDLNRWRVLGIDSKLAYVNSFDRNRLPLGVRILDEVPNPATAELRPDGSVLHIERRSQPARVVLTRMDASGRVALEREFPTQGRFIERAHAVVELEGLDTRYAVLAETGSFSDGFQAPWLLMLDGQGAVLRQRVLENSLLLPARPNDRQGVLTATDDGGLAFAAFVDGYLRLIRFDSAGEELWNSEPLGPGEPFALFSPRFETAAAVIEIGDGGFLVVGSRKEPGAWAARLNTDGDVVWRHEYEPVSGRPLAVTAVLETSVGFTLGGVHDGEPFVMQIDGAGTVQRASFFPFGGAAAGPITRLAPADDEGLVLATSWVDSDEPLGDIGDGAASTGRINVLLLRLDEDLEPSWYRVYGALYDEHVADIQAVPEGGWLVAARSDSLGDRGEGWLLRVDYEGLITESCNAYLEGGEWVGLSVAIPMTHAAYLPDVEPEELAPADLELVDTPAIPQFPPASVVARQCFGFGPAGRPEEPPPSDGSYTLTLRFAGGGLGTVQSFPAGIDCRSTCSAVFPAGTEVALTPIRDEGFFFSHWEDCDQDFGEEGCIVLMSSDRTVTVYFE